MSRTTWIIIAVVVAIAAIVGVVLVTDDDEGRITESGAGGLTESPAADVSGTVSVMAVWTGEEQASFQAVIDEFTKLYPNVTVELHVGRRPAADGALHRRAGRQPAERRSRRPAGAHDATS